MQGGIVLEGKGIACPTKLLDDDPAEIDEFGSHERVADNIVRLVSEETQGRSIALIGDWGSGKSTVVKIVEKKSPESTQVFVFDAWSHQGDPLRRTFLETLMTFLAGAKWLEHAQKWSEKRAELAHRRKVACTIETPVLGKLGQLLVVLIALMPIGLALAVSLAPTFDPTVTWPTSAKVGFAIGLVLGLAPFFALLLAVLYWRFGSGHGAGDSSDENVKDSFFSLLFNRSQTVTHSETLETPEPTSVEFQEVFDDLVKESLVEEGRKLVIVVDNLDRIDHSDALSIWATMRTFLEPRHGPREEWRQRLWLVVPFAPDGVKTLWETEGAGDFTKSAADRFVDKTFQMSLRVSPPVLSRWMDFLLGALKRALPEHDEADFHAVYRIFQWGRSQRAEEQSAPTPREIKMFVNHIGALHRQWGDDIPLAQQAFFVVKETLGWKPATEITTNKLEEESKAVIGHLGKDWRQGLAALFLNVPKEQALQVLMTTGIQDALSTGDGKKLASMKDSAGFLVNVEQVVATICFEPSAGDNSRIGIAPLALRHLAEPDNQMWVSIWSTLADAAEAVTEWRLEEFEAVCEGVAILICHRPTERFSKRIVSSLSLSSPTAEQFTTSWLSGTQIVLRTVMEKVDGGGSICEELRVMGEAVDYCRTVSAVDRAQLDRQFLRFLRPQADVQAILEHVTSLITAGTYASDDRNVIEALLECGMTCDWGGVVEALGEALERAEDVTESRVAPLLWPLMRLQEVEKGARSRLDTASSNGRVMHYLGLIRGTSDNQTVALVILAQLESPVVSTPYDRSGEGIEFFKAFLAEPQGYSEVLHAFVDVVIEFSSVERLLESESHYPDAADLVTATLERIVTKADASKIVGPDVLIQKHNTISQRLQEDSYSRLMKMSTTSTELVELVRSEDFQRGRSLLYSAIWESLDDGDSAYGSYLVDGLQGMSTEVWMEELDANGEALGLAIRLHKGGLALNLSTELADALHQHALRVADSSASIEQLGDSWQLMFDMLAVHSRNTLAKNILDDVINNSEVANGLIRCCGPVFTADWSILEPRADDLLRTGFRRFVETRDAFAIHWMRDLATKYARKLRLKKFRDSVKDLGDRIDDALADEALGAQVESDLRETADALRISISGRSGPEGDVTEK